MIPRAGPGGVLLPRVHRRLLNTEAEAALTLTLPLTLPPPCYFRLRRCRHCRRHRRRHRRHANAGLCLQCPVRLCRDLEICFTSKSLCFRAVVLRAYRTLHRRHQHVRAPFPRMRGASPRSAESCPHIFTPWKGPFPARGTFAHTCHLTTAGQYWGPVVKRLNSNDNKHMHYTYTKVENNSLDQSRRVTVRPVYTETEVRAGPFPSLPGFPACTLA